MFKKNNQNKINFILFRFFFFIVPSTLLSKNLITIKPLKSNIQILNAKNKNLLNRLKTVTLIPRTLHAEETEGDLYQLRLHFEQPLNFEKECNNETSTIKLSFYNINRADLEAKQFVETCKKISFIKNVTIITEEYPISRVVISLECLPESTLVKIQKNNDAHIVNIDFYDKNILTKIKNGTDILRMAYNTGTQTVLPSLT